MSETPPPGGGSGGGDGPPRILTSSQVRPDQTFAGAAQAAGGLVPGGRSWQQIFKDAKERRNILEIHINKTSSDNPNEVDTQKPKALTFDQLSDFLFKVLGIKDQDCIGLDYFFGHKEVELKEGVDVSPYLHVNTPIKYLEHDIFVKRQETNFATKILFRNVPLNVPDEEVINLALCYGQPVGVVRREKLTNMKDKGKIGSNRSLDVLLNPGCTFENYYWLEGPLPSDQGRRITVTHQNQPTQCSNCFGYSRQKYGTELNLCPGNGIGRVCKAMETERAKMGPYMRVLERLVGYKSLKARYSRVGVFEPIEDEEESEVTDTTVYKSPVIERDEKIEELIVEKDVLRK